VYFIFGHKLAAAACVQIVLDSLSCFLLYFLSVKIFRKEGVGLLASLIYACYSIAIFYTGFLLDTTLVVFLNILSFLLLLYAEEKKKALLWVLAGVIAGLSALMKASILLFLPFFAVWLLYVRRKEKILKRTALDITFLIFGVIVVIAPFAVRNYVIDKKFMPFPVQGGLNFFIGNNPVAEGTYISFTEIPDSPIEQVKASVRLAERELRKEGRIPSPEKHLTQSQASNYWFLKGLRFIVNNKYRYLRLCLKKIFLFWNAEEIYLNVNYYFCQKFIPVLNFPFFSFGIIAPFAILGFIFAIREKLRNAYPAMLFIFAQMISLILYYVVGRYRMPAAPFIIMFCAYGIFSFKVFLNQEKLKELVVFSLLLVVLFMAVNKERAPVNSKNNFAASYSNLGNVYFAKRMPDEAIREYKNAIKERPDYTQAHLNLGNVYYLKNMFKEAAAEFEETVKLDPYNGQAHNNLAVYYYYIERNSDLMVQHLSRALEYGASVNPEFLRELMADSLKPRP